MQPSQTTDAIFILIRGLGRESGHWGRFPEALEKKLPGVVVRCIDLPGTGENLAMQSPVKMRALSEFVRNETQFLRSKMKIENAKIFVLAPSLGGMITTDWMLNYPRDLSGAILINTSFASWSTIWQRLQPQVYHHVLKIVLNEKDSFVRESEVVQMVSNHKDKVLVHAKEWAQVFAARPIRNETILRQLLAARDFTPPKTKPETPVLLLNSVNDRMVDPKCSEIIQRHWDCPMFKHPWAGHDIPLDDPNWVIDKTVAWYESLGESYQMAFAVES